MQVGLLGLVALVLLGGCTTAGRTSASFHQVSQARLVTAAEALEEGAPASAQAEYREDTPPESGCASPPSGWPDVSSSNTEELLAPFLACTSPSGFVRLQRGVDMARLVRRLDDWSAVRLGALGPVLPEAAEALNRKRVSFLLSATQEYGTALAEVFVLFVIHSAFDKDLGQVLHQLARDKRLEQTLGRMAVAREHLRQRGFNFSDYPERPERFGDSLRGALEATGDVVSSAPLFQVGVPLEYTARKEQLPARYRQALDEVERALAKDALEPGNVLLGVVDELTFGVPLGFYHLAAGVGQGAHSLTQGQYEQATRELTPAVLMVALYAGGKGARYLSEVRGTPGTPVGGRVFQGLESRLEELKATAERLREQLGGEGLQEVARYMRADPEAALLVIDGGEAGVAALHAARGNVPKARAWLSQAKSDRPGSTQTGGGVGKSPGGVASLADEAAGLPREVLDARLLEVELDVPGPRLSGNVAVLEKQLAALEKTAPTGATGHPLWSEYLQYGKERLADLQQGKKVRKGRKLEPPLQWEGYQKMRGLVTRGLAFERAMAKLLRDDAALPRAQRRFLQDFDSPRVETYVGVHKPGVGLRFADVLVIEQKPLSGQPPRVETFSFKSRDLSVLGTDALTAQLIADARAALGYYGETLSIRRPGLKGSVKVQRVRLIYEGGALMPKEVDELRRAVNATRSAVPGVEVLFQ